MKSRLDYIIELKKKRLNYRIEDIKKNIKKGYANKPIAEANIKVYEYAIFLLDDILEEYNN